MFGGAGLRRAAIPAAAALLFIVEVNAQTEAERMVEKFAREAERAQTTQQAARTEEAKAKKDAERKAAQTAKVLEIRKRAEASRAEAEARRRAEETRAAEEEEMLARARREAEEAKATNEIRRLIEQAEAERTKAEALLAEEAKLGGSQTAASKSIEEGLAVQRLAAETEAERASAAARQVLARLADNKHLVATMTRMRRSREARLAAHALRAAHAAELERARLEEASRGSLRVAENRRLVHGLIRARRQHQTRLAQARVAQLENRIAKAPAAEVVDTPPIATVLADPKQPSDRAGLGGEPNGRVTVLLTMVPGTYGIRRGAMVADPVLCVLDGCYVSAGPAAAAKFLPGWKALGIGNTFGARAGACRHSLGCVFRDVKMRMPGALQPVDLHILKHDRRQPQVIAADSNCRLAGGRLACNVAFRAADYTLWILPERLAHIAGAEVLQGAVRDGLVLSRSADAAPSR